MSSLDDANEKARIKALLINAWPDGRHRYHHDALFHWAIHHAAQMACSGRSLWPLRTDLPQIGPLGSWCCNSPRPHIPTS